MYASDYTREFFPNKEEIVNFFSKQWAWDAPDANGVQISPDDIREWLSDKEVLYMGGTFDDYQEDCTALFKCPDNKLWWVSGGHCSCYGYEDQWNPEETSVEAIARMKNYNLCLYSTTSVEDLVEYLKISLGLKTSAT